MPLCNIEPVSDDELCGDVESHIRNLDMGALLIVFDEQRADLKTGGLSREKPLTQIRKRQSTVDDVFDDNDVSTTKIDVKILDDADDPTRLCRRAVRRNCHEVDLDGRDPT